MKVKKTIFEYVHKRTKRVVGVHEVPVERILSDGSAGFTFETAERLDQMLKMALALKNPRVELWFVPKVLRTSRVSPRQAA